MSDKIFTSDDLVWTKNVKRDGGNDWAYTEPEIRVGALFYLNWPRGNNEMGKSDAQKIKVNQLILLFQTVNKNSGYRKGTYLTHIVTPVDDKVIEDELGTHPYKRLVTVVARAETPIPKPFELSFSEPNSGWACGLQTIKPLRRLNRVISTQEKQQLFWNLFTNKDPKLKEMNIAVQAIANSEQPDDPSEGAVGYWLGLHKYYERDPDIIKRKKKSAEQAGLLFCEVCRFDFFERFGLHGSGFIECHHTFPIAGNGERRTKVEDLALVCSNCHRMLHRKNPEGRYYTIEELRGIYIPIK